MDAANNKWGSAMRPMTFFRLLLICAAACISTVVYGANFALVRALGNDADFISIQGEIKPGDYEKFQRFLIQPNNVWAFANRVFLTSDGGNIVEALKFANLFENAFIHVRVSDHCYSSCFIMYAAAVNRGLISMGEIGVHKIELRKFKSDIEDAENLISKQANSVNGYLAHLGIPSEIIGKMNETPSPGMYKMDHWILNGLNLISALDYQPIYLDAVEKECGKNPDPYPGELTIDKPRDPQTMVAIRVWASCENESRLKNFSKFMAGEYALLSKNEPSILFPPGSLAEVNRDVFGGK